MYDFYDDMEEKKKGKEKKKVCTKFFSLLNLQIKIILKCKNKYNMQNKTRILSVLTIYKQKKKKKENTKQLYILNKSLIYQN